MRHKSVQHGTRSVRVWAADQPILVTVTDYTVEIARTNHTVRGTAPNGIRITTRFNRV